MCRCLSIESHIAVPVAGVGGDIYPKPCRWLEGVGSISVGKFYLNKMQSLMDSMEDIEFCSIISKGYLIASFRNRLTVTLGFERIICIFGKNELFFTVMDG